MALNDHARLGLLIDGVYQIEVTNISVQFDSGAVRIDTLEGLAGKSDGSGSVTISVSQAIPLGGLEFDFVSALATGTYHQMQIPIGAKSYIGNGWFQSGSGGQGVNAASEAGWEWTGELSELE